MIELILQEPQWGIAMFAMLILAISVHEMAHAWMALKRGDDTAAMMGRLTLNPVAHFDPVGFLFILFMMFGWGKPVPVNPLNLRDMRYDGMLIAAAGPASNIIQAVCLAILFRICMVPPIGNFLLSLPSGESILVSFIIVMKVGVSINLALAFFNLIPLFPLDGEKILTGILPYEQARVFERYRNQSVMILLALIMIGFAFNFPILSYFISFFVHPISNFLIGSSPLF